MNKSKENNKPETEWPPRKVVCVGAVVLQNEKVLFIRQAPYQSLEGQWSIPWGFIEADETPENAALRETLEEGGVSVTIDGLLGFQNLSPSGWIGMVFLCHHQSGEPAADGVETDRARYMGLADFDHSEGSISPWCEWLARRVLAGEYTLVKEAADTRSKSGRAFL